MAVSRRFDADHRGQVLFAGAGEPGAVHETGEADAPPDRAGAVLGGKSRGLRVVVGERERAVEQPWHVDGLAHHLADGIGLTRGDEVAAAKLLGREPRRCGDLVHLQLEREHRLRRAESAERAVRRRVGGNRLRTDPDVRAVVGTGRVNGPA